MELIGWFINNPVKVSVAMILLVLFGLIAMFNMPMQLSPEVTRPQISILTMWPGASPHEIETKIIKEQEEKLKSVEGVTKMSSECRTSSGSVSLEFRVGTNMNEALLKVNSQLQQVRDYPIDAQKPVIRSSNQNDRSAGWFILTKKPPSPEQVEEFSQRFPELREKIKRAVAPRNVGLQIFRLKELAAEHPEVAPLVPAELDVPKYRKFMEDVLKPQFDRVPGVADAMIRGGELRQLHVIVDPAKLSARGLTIADLRTAFLQNNADISGGNFVQGKQQIGVRTIGKYQSVEEVAGQIIAQQDGTSVYVRDVAEVKLGFEKNTGFVRRLGERTASISVQLDTTANAVEVMRELSKVTERLNRGVLDQMDLTLVKMYDETTYIESAVGLVQQNIILGGALTIIVLMLFLHLGRRSVLIAPIILATALIAISGPTWVFAITLAIILGAGFWFARGTLVVAIAIPLSVIGTFLFLRYMGRTLNVISLAGLAFAVGMLVDSAIVVLENIVRFIDKGMSPREAGRRGAGEVWGAVMASTLTTLAVFLPVIFLQGEVGQLFGDIALAICIAVGLSLIVSVIVIPTAASRLYTDGKDHGQPEEHSEIAQWLARFGGRFSDWITSTNSYFARHVTVGLTMILVIIGASFAFAWWQFPKIEYLPAGNRNLVFCTILTPPGYSIYQLDEMGAEVEAILRPYWDVDPETEDTSHLDYPSIADFFYMARDRSVFAGMRAHDDLRARKMVEMIQKKLRDRFPGTTVIASQTSLFGRGMGGGRNIDLEITGPSLERLVELGGQMMGSIRENFPDDVQVRANPGLDLSNPELHVRLRQEQAAAVGITSDELGYNVSALVDGAYAADYYMDGDKIDLVIKGAETELSLSPDIMGQYIATRNLAEPVRLEAIARASLSSGPEQIHHRELQRAITLEFSPPTKMSLEEAIDLINRKVIAPLEADGTLGAEYTVNLSGTADKLAQTWNALKWNFALAILITYLLMAALFESWTYPLVIMLSVPLGAVGGIIGLLALSRYLESIGEPPQSLDVLTMLGFVILVGTVVNNAILIVHQSRIFRGEGIEPLEAITESVRTRIRPIFMSTLTTLFGLSPLVFFPGAGSELYRGLGAVVLGGLLLSTLLTLFLIPTMLSLVVRIELFLSGQPINTTSKSSSKRESKREERPASPGIQEPSGHKPTTQPQPVQ
ncbi:MAG: efflux RND transporter permease subunit [Pirellulaceae bacterium]|nr:efflux RND transporter permease subunit [Pirellulaceae bacterium]